MGNKVEKLFTKGHDMILLKKNKANCSSVCFKAIEYNSIRVTLNAV